MESRPRVKPAIEKHKKDQLPLGIFKNSRRKNVDIYPNAAAHDSACCGLIASVGLLSDISWPASRSRRARQSRHR